MPTTGWIFYLLVGLGGLVVGLIIAWAVSRRKSARKESDLSVDYFRGLNYLLNEEPDKAIEVFIQALEVDEDTVELHFALGKLFRRSGELDRATRLHQNLIARPTLSTAQRQTAVYELAQDYMSAGLYDRAVGLFEELTTARDYRELALSALVRVYELEKDWTAAIDASRSLDEMEPENKARMLHYHCEIAEFGFTNDDMEMVEASLDEAQKLDPSSPRVIMLKVQLLLRACDWSRVIDYWEQLMNEHLQYAAVIDGVFENLDRMTENQQRKVLNLTKTLVINLEDLPMAERAIALCGVLDGSTAVSSMLHEWADQCTGPVRTFALQRLVRAGKETPAGYAALASFVSSTVIGIPDYLCSECGFEAKAMLWQCPNCNTWGSLLRQLANSEVPQAEPVD